MKIKKLITIEKEQEAQFTELKLLSRDEYERYEKNIPVVNIWWWLSSHGWIDYSVAVIDPNGMIRNYVMYDDINSIRPVLTISQESPNLKIGDKFRFYNHNWTVISETFALCDEEFCEMEFRKNWKAKDVNAYETSDIKKYIDAEWEKMKNEN